MTTTRYIVILLALIAAAPIALALLAVGIVMLGVGFLLAPAIVTGLYFRRRKARAARRAGAV